MSRRSAPRARSLLRARIRLVCLLLLLTVAVQAREQAELDPTVDLEHGFEPNFQIYLDTDGLPQSSVRSLAFDRHGYLWVGTQSGAGWFNGRTWRTIHLPNRQTSDFVTAILPRADGSVWLGSMLGGVARLAEGVFTTATRRDSTLPGDSVRAFAETREPEGATRVWIATDRGLATCTGDVLSSCAAVEASLPSTDVHSLAVERGAGGGGDVLWVGTADGIARRAGNGVWSQHSAAELGIAKVPIQALALEPTAEGETIAWLGSAGAGLVRLHAGRAEVLDEATTGLPLGTVSALAVSAEATAEPTLWIGTTSGLFWRRGEHLELAADDAHGLPSDAVWSLAVHADGPAAQTLWIGTYEGLVRHTDGPWVALTPSNTGLPGRVVMAILESRDAAGSAFYWVGTWGRGLVITDGRSWRRPEPPLAAPNVRCLLETRTRDGAKVLWVGTHDQGLARLADGRWSFFTTKSSPLPSDNVRALALWRREEGGEELLIGTGEGLARLSPDGWQVLSAANSPLPQAAIQALAETVDARGVRSLWIGTLGKGLIRVEGERWSVLDAAGSPLPNDQVLALLPIRGEHGAALWVGTRGGAARIDLSGAEPRWTTLTLEGPLALHDNVVYQIRQDRFGRTYFFTNKGIARVLSDDGPLEIFTTEHGLPHNEQNSGATLIDSRGRLWAGNMGGIAVLTPVETPSPPAPLRIERIVAGERELALESSDGAPFRLGYRENQIAVEYALLSFRAQSALRYRSQLVGLEDAPGPWSTDVRRTFTNLRHGDYRFEVWARDGEGRVIGPAVVSWHLATPPWRSWWAWLGYVLASAGTVLALVRWRERSLRQQTALLEAAVAARTAELEVSRQEALAASRAKSEFLAVMSHEIRTPMTGVLGVADLLLESDLAPEQRRLASILRRSGESLLELITDVLDFSRIEAGKVERMERVFAPRELAADLLHTLGELAHRRGLALVCDVAPRVPAEVMGDPSLVRQILVNLVGNAIKFTEHGEVSVRLDVVRESETGVELSFDVHDTGIGIAPEHQTQIFEVFTQLDTGASRRYRGTGLGLAISQRLARLLGGELTVESEPGRGSTFRLRVPLRRGDTAATVPKEPAAEAPAPSERLAGRVLVVDDEPINQLVCRRMVQKLGCEPEVASNGEIALEKLESGSYALVLLDCMMPVRDGYSTVAELRRREQLDPARGHTPVIALTASALAGDREKCLAAGMDDYLPKPFRAEELRAVMARWLG